MVPTLPLDRQYSVVSGIVFGWRAGPRFTMRGIPSPCTPFRTECPKHAYKSSWGILTQELRAATPCTRRSSISNRMRNESRRAWSSVRASLGSKGWPDRYGVVCIQLLSEMTTNASAQQRQLPIAAGPLLEFSQSALALASFRPQTRARLYVRR
jgi:hypothetical protein